jgi:crossover junction endodeoxyribonuclease RuvC
MNILGVDPGSLVTGYGIIRFENNSFQCVDYGCIRLAKEATMAKRLEKLHNSLHAILESTAIDSAGLESVFMAKNPDSALKLGQARGVILLTLSKAGLHIDDYSPRLVKQTIVGKGSADKTQVNFMVKQLLSIQQTIPEDAADALAIAICHAQHLTRKKLEKAYL